MSAGFNMTEARSLILRSAHHYDAVAVVSEKGGRKGLEAVAWQRNCAALAEAGYLEPSAHSDWYLTEKAEAYLSAAQGAA